MGPEIRLRMGRGGDLWRWNKIAGGNNAWGVKALWAFFWFFKGLCWAVFGVLEGKMRVEPMDSFNSSC